MCTWQFSGPGEDKCREWGSNTRTPAPAPELSEERGCTTSALQEKSPGAEPVCCLPVCLYLALLQLLKVSAFLFSTFSNLYVFPSFLPGHCNLWWHHAIRKSQLCCFSHIAVNYIFTASILSYIQNLIEVVDCLFNLEIWLDCTLHVTSGNV